MIRLAPGLRCPIAGSCFPVFPLAVVVTLLVATTPLVAATWHSVAPDVQSGKVSLVVAGQAHTYYELAPETPTVLQLRGPRRLKIVSRYLFGVDDPSEQNYSVRVVVDGLELLRKSFTSGIKSGVSLAGEPGVVAALRKCYINIGTGTHTVQVFATPDGSGRVAARFFRESKRQQTTYVPYAPDEFDTLYQLQFASGAQSTYYHFGSGSPLCFTVTGPTTLKVYTRLALDHHMNERLHCSL